jgi:hypothetical protein
MPRADAPGLVSVSPDRIFRTGERFRVRLYSQREGCFYVVLRGSSGEVKILYPSAGTPLELNSVGYYESRTVPDDAWFRFDDAPGMEDLYVVWSDGSLPALDRALVADAELNFDDLRNLLARSRGTRVFGRTPQTAVQHLRLLHAARDGEVCPAPVQPWRRIR